MAEPKNQSIVFGPQPLTRTPKNKKIFGLILILFWIVIIITIIIALLTKQDSQNLEKTGQGLLDVIPDQSENWPPQNQQNIDKLLGATPLNESATTDQQTSDPANPLGSIDKLLEGKEIIIP